MTSYTKTTNFLIKDSLPSGNSSKIVKGSEIDTEFNNVQSADGDNLKLSALGSGVNTFLTSPTASNLATLLANEDSYVQAYNVKNYGAAGDGVTDDSTSIATAIAAAAGKILYFPKGTYLIGTGLAVADGAKTTLVGDGPGSIIKKGANIDMITLGKQCSMIRLYLDGTGGTYTGRGVVISSGSLDNTSWRYINSCWIMDTASYGVEFTAAQAGYASSIVDSWIVPTATATTAVKFPANASGEANGNRTMINVMTKSNPMADFGGSINAQIVGCQGGSPVYGSNSTKIAVSGSRFVASGTAFTFDGNSNVISGTTLNPTTGITFSSSLINSTFVGNMVDSSSTITDNAPGTAQGNNLYYHNKTFTPTWTGSAVNPAIGDGTLTGHYIRRGDMCKFRIAMVAGGTTTFGTGYWIFTLPFNTSGTLGTIGSAIMHDSTAPTIDWIGGAPIGYSAFCGTDQVVAVVTNQAAGQLPIGSGAGAYAPFAWASGDYMVIEGEFRIA